MGERSDSKLRTSNFKKAPKQFQPKKSGSRPVSGRKVKR